MDNQDIVIKLSDFLALLYHESRNVRHLVKKEQTLDPKFLSLRDRLATNRYEAWKQVQPLRLAARRMRSGKQVESIFKQHFSLTLDDLITLYAYPSWKGMAYGGNAWLPIAYKVKELIEVFDTSRDDDARCLVKTILEMSHNTGKVNEKLRNLDSY